MMNNITFFAEDRRVSAALTGIAIGVSGGILALLIVLVGPVLAFGFMLGLGVALYVLTDLHGGLYMTIAVIALLPFAQVPFEMSPRPTLLDGAMGGFLIVYLFQWMTGQRRLFRSTPVTPIVLTFTGFMFFAYLMGLRHAAIDMRTLRTIAEMLISLLLIPVLIDVMRDETMLRRAVLALMIFGAAEALIGIVLWALPDLTAETILNRLGRFGYPMGGVIRYRENNVAMLNERAIGTWVDPNAFGGFLLMIGAVIAPQLFAEKPVAKRWHTAVMLGLVVIALFLTDSRGSMLSLGAAFTFIAAIRYRRLLVIMGVVVLLSLPTPFMQRYIDKLAAGFTNQDVETQMRWGEYKDAVTLITRHPVFGAGFSATPEIDLYFGVASTYLTVASHAGLTGLALYLLMMGGAFVYSMSHYRAIQ
ncbi:MAG: O-antigen ligase family protein, partial [Anaerolineae bacterium]|nr:O-antigen ligase family protein [Anaerolineae bacterium]